MAIDRATLLKITDLRDGNGDRVPFSARTVSYDKKRGRNGSKHVYHAKVTRGGAAHDLHRHGQIAFHPVDGGHPIPVHIDLIVEINDQQVI